MCLFLILYWCSCDGAKVIPGSADLIPDWAAVNSRLARLREFARKPLTFLTFFYSQMAITEAKSAKFPARRE
jgi:hypothetical protein